MEQTNPRRRLTLPKALVRSNVPGDNRSGEDRSLRKKERKNVSSPQQVRKEGRKSLGLRDGSNRDTRQPSADRRTASNATLRFTKSPSPAGRNALLRGYQSKDKGLKTSTSAGGTNSSLQAALLHGPRSKDTTTSTTNNVRTPPDRPTSVNRLKIKGSLANVELPRSSTTRGGVRQSHTAITRSSCKEETSLVAGRVSNRGAAQARSTSLTKTRPTQADSRRSRSLSASRRTSIQTTTEAKKSTTSMTPEGSRVSFQESPTLLKARRKVSYIGGQNVSSYGSSTKNNSSRSKESSPSIYKQSKYSVSPKRSPQSPDEATRKVACPPERLKKAFEREGNFYSISEKRKPGAHLRNEMVLLKGQMKEVQEERFQMDLTMRSVITDLNVKALMMLGHNADEAGGREEESKDDMITFIELAQQLKEISQDLSRTEVVTLQLTADLESRSVEIENIQESKIMELEAERVTHTTKISELSQKVKDMEQKQSASDAKVLQLSADVLNASTVQVSKIVELECQVDDLLQERRNSDAIISKLRSQVNLSGREVEEVECGHEVNNSGEVEHLTDCGEVMAFTNENVYGSTDANVSAVVELNSQAQVLAQERSQSEEEEKGLSCAPDLSATVEELKLETDRSDQDVGYINACSGGSTSQIENLHSAATKLEDDEQERGHCLSQSSVTKQQLEAIEAKLSQLGSQQNLKDAEIKGLQQEAAEAKKEVEAGAQITQMLAQLEESQRKVRSIEKERDAGLIKIAMFRHEVETMEVKLSQSDSELKENVAEITTLQEAAAQNREQLETERNANVTTVDKLNKQIDYLLGEQFKSEEQKMELKNEISRVKGKVADLEEAREAEETKITGLTQQLGEAEQERSILNSKMLQMTKSVRGWNAQILSLQKEVEESHQNLTIVQGERDAGLAEIGTLNQKIETMEAEMTQKDLELSANAEEIKTLQEEAARKMIKMRELEEERNVNLNKISELSHQLKPLRRIVKQVARREQESIQNQGETEDQRDANPTDAKTSELCQPGLEHRKLDSEKDCSKIRNNNAKATISVEQEFWPRESTPDNEPTTANNTPVVVELNLEDDRGEKTANERETKPHSFDCALLLKEEGEIEEDLDANPTDAKSLELCQPGLEDHKLDGEKNYAKTSDSNAAPTTQEQEFSLQGSQHGAEASTPKRSHYSSRRQDQNKEGGRGGKAILLRRPLRFLSSQYSPKQGAFPCPKQGDGDAAAGARTGDEPGLERSRLSENAIKLHNLQERIQMLEKEKAEQNDRIKSLGANLEEQRRENAAKSIKIAALEVERNESSEESRTSPRSVRSAKAKAEFNCEEVSNDSTMSPISDDVSRGSTNYSDFVARELKRKEAKISTLRKSREKELNEQTVSALRSEVIHLRNTIKSKSYQSKQHLQVLRDINSANSIKIKALESQLGIA